uniref:Tf2-1-like SH3-like domain-containing protein n=1 Tax=Oryza brachyantha TaxID=4533 RepID=J3N7R9_ORYBR
MSMPLFGVDPHYSQVPALHHASHSDVHDFIHERQQLSAFLQHQLARAQLRMKNQVDKGHSNRSFSIGDSVFIKLQPYAQSSVVNRPYPKLLYKFYGPFVILEKIGAVAYRLDLPDSSLTHPVFHVLNSKSTYLIILLYLSPYLRLLFWMLRMWCLKEHIPDHTPVFDHRLVKKEAILDHRLVKKDSSDRRNYPVTSYTKFYLGLIRATRMCITFKNFIIQAGTDTPLVPTDMATANSAHGGEAEHRCLVAG